MSTAAPTDGPIVDLVPAPKPDMKRPPIENVPGRLGPAGLNQIRALGERPWKQRLAKAALLIPKIRHWEARFLPLPDEEMKRVSMQLRGRARGGTSLDKLIPEAFGLCSAAIRRMFGYQLFDVQLAAGVVMHFGGLVELATGEGKTISAVSPAFLNALVGKGVHVTTVNDYLAKRDATDMGPVYGLLGLTCGCIQQKMEDADRVEQYKCDVTYGTASEFGFDFLRDRLKLRGGQAQAAPFYAPWLAGGGAARMDPRVQRELYYAIVDEADSIFIDEARTPLIISILTREATPEEQVVYKWADEVAVRMT